MEKIIFNRSQAAEMLQVKPCTLYKWERQKKITPAFHVNGRPRYTFEEIERVASENNNKKG